MNKLKLGLPKGSLQEPTIRLFEKDPKLEKSEHSLLAKELARVWTSEAGEWS